MKKLLILGIGMALGTTLHAMFPPKPSKLKFRTPGLARGLDPKFKDLKKNFQEKANLLLEKPVDDRTLNEWKAVQSILETVRKIEEEGGRTDVMTEEEKAADQVLAILESRESPYDSDIDLDDYIIALDRYKNKPRFKI